MTSDAPDPTLTDEQYHGIFEGLYARAGSDLSAVPWAELRPNPALVEWLEANPLPSGARALVVGCGLGDDAEFLTAHGLSVTAFDFSPTAILRAQERFADSRVEYLVADLLAMPEQWRGAFALVVDNRTLQSMPTDRRRPAVTAIAATLAPGGTLFLRGLAADDGNNLGGPPWPVTPSQLTGFTRAGLARAHYQETPITGPLPGRPADTATAATFEKTPRAWSFTALYRRPPDDPPVNHSNASAATRSSRSRHQRSRPAGSAQRSSSASSGAGG